MSGPLPRTGSFAATRAECAATAARSSCKPAYMRADEGRGRAGEILLRGSRGRTSLILAAYKCCRLWPGLPERRQLAWSKVRNYQPGSGNVPRSFLGCGCKACSVGTLLLVFRLRHRNRVGITEVVDIDPVGFPGSHRRQRRNHGDTESDGANG